MKTKLEEQVEKLIKGAPGALFSSGVNFVAGLVLDSLFGGGEPAWVDEFRKQFIEIRDDVAKVHKAVVKLGLLIEAQGVKEAQDHLTADLKSCLELAYEWREGKADKEVARDCLQNLQRSRNYLFENSFGHFTILGATIVMECRLAQAAGFHKKTLLAFCDSYLNYFGECKNKANELSIAGRLSVAEAKLALYKKTHPDSHERVIEAYWVGWRYVHPGPPDERLDDSIYLTSAHYAFTGALGRKSPPAFDLLGPHKGEKTKPTKKGSSVYNSRKFADYSVITDKAPKVLARWNKDWEPYNDLLRVRIPVLKNAIIGITKLEAVVVQLKEWIDKHPTLKV